MYRLNVKTELDRNNQSWCKIGTIGGTLDMVKQLLCENSRIGRVKSITIKIDYDDTANTLSTLADVREDR